MFDFLKKGCNADKDAIAKRLAVKPEDLKRFEEIYKSFETPFRESAGEGMTAAPDTIIDRIVEELMDQNAVISCINGEISYQAAAAEPRTLVTLTEVTALPKNKQPDLTGWYMRRDINEDAYIELMNMLMMFEKTHNMSFYHRFRQGLDLLDLDPVSYEMLSCNKNSMGYWLPKIASAAKGIFKIPDTVIAKVPITLLQLTRREYQTLTKTTMKIVDRWAQRTFGLKQDKKYFLKTGTYSSKFDFRNARITEPKEVLEIGEYLLYIHFSALQMAQYNLQKNSKSSVIYGISTTNEWVVRDFIEDKEDNPCIYHGMPLHTEYRVFADFDTKEVFGVHPYWDPDTMKNRFDNYSDNLSPDMLHDSVIYRAHEPVLMKRYNDNKEHILELVQQLAGRTEELCGQWSIDILQNGDDFYLIDMAVAERSAFYDNVVPVNKRKPIVENWIPKLN